MWHIEKKVSKDYRIDYINITMYNPVRLVEGSGKQKPCSGFTKPSTIKIDRKYSVGNRSAPR